MFSRSAAALCLFALVLLSCSQKMNVQPRYSPMAASDFFRDGTSARMPVTGTVARDRLEDDPFLYEGRVGGRWADSFPFPVTREVVERGRDRFEIFCSPCHGRLGDGKGMIVQRGLRGPVSFHEQRFREYPVGYLFNVVTNGRGAMYPYGYRIPVRDRWSIIAYVRALQLSQNVTAAALSDDERAKLGGGR